MMPTFLVITGYLVNVEKSIKEFCVYLVRIILPYVIMVCGYMVVSMYLPVRDGVQSLDLKTFYGVLLITSIGPYWLSKYTVPCFSFDNTGILHALFTMIICVIGSILVAKVMDVSHCSYIFARKAILR